METIEEKKERINTLFNLARLAGVVKTQREFAEFLGINENTVGRALKGDERYLSENFFTRVENAFNEAGIEIHGNNSAPVNNQQGDELQNTQETPGAFGKLIDEMQAQREMYDKHLSEALRIISKLTEKNG